MRGHHPTPPVAGAGKPTLRRCSEVVSHGYYVMLCSLLAKLRLADAGARDLRYCQEPAGPTIACSKVAPGVVLQIPWWFFPVFSYFFFDV